VWLEQGRLKLLVYYGRKRHRIGGVRGSGTGVHKSVNAHSWSTSRVLDRYEISIVRPGDPQSIYVRRTESYSSTPFGNSVGRFVDFGAARKEERADDSMGTRL
jgi:hypothetical protein